MYIQQRDSIEPYVTADGSLIRELAHPQNSPARRQSLAEATVEVGGATREHLHRHTEEIYFIVQGQGLMRLEDETRAVGPGDAIIIRPGRRHCISNTGTVPLVLLCCCAPAYSHEDTFLL